MGPEELASVSKVDETAPNSANHRNGMVPERRRSSQEVCQDLIEFEKQMPPPDVSGIYADAQWIDDNWAELLKKYPGTHIAVVDKLVRATAWDALQMELDLARSMAIHPQRIVTVYIPSPNDPWR